MKNLILLLCLLCIGPSLVAQDNTAPENDLIIGFTFAPQGITSFEGDPPFEVIAPLYFGPTWFKGKWGVNPFYSFGGNSIGVFVMHSFNDDLGSYLVLEQSLSSDFGLVGAGLTTPLFENYVQGFLELAHSYGDDAQMTMSLGMFISFGKSVKTW